jgi:hypothetical protein
MILPRLSAYDGKIQKAKGSSALMSLFCAAATVFR